VSGFASSAGWDVLDVLGLPLDCEQPMTATPRPTMRIGIVSKSFLCNISPYLHLHCPPSRDSSLVAIPTWHYRLGATAMPLRSFTSSAQEDACLHHLSLFLRRAWCFVICAHRPGITVRFATKDGRIYTGQQS
jgi:hypothetical protein